jgi:hypothetical protein
MGPADRWPCRRSAGLHPLKRYQPLDPEALAEIAVAHGTLLDELAAGPAAPRRQPELDAAVRHGAQRPLGGAAAWQRRGIPVDVSPLSAATLAVWGLLYGPAEYDLLESVLLRRLPESGRADRPLAEGQAFPVDGTSRGRRMRTEHTLSSADERVFASVPPKPHNGTYRAQVSGSGRAYSGRRSYVSRAGLPSTASYSRFGRKGLGRPGALLSGWQ